MHRLRRGLIAVVASGAIGLASCHRPPETVRAQYLPVAEVERTFGPLIGAANQPTQDQHGNGTRVGLFRDPGGTIWGLPLSVGKDASVLACAPPALRHAEVTDHLAPGSSIAGSTNRPSGWRGGTGDLELLLRDTDGTIRRQAVRGADLPGGLTCGPAERPEFRPPLHYFRLAPAPPSR